LRDQYAKVSLSARDLHSVDLEALKSQLDNLTIARTKAEDEAKHARQTRLSIKTICDDLASQIPARDDLRGKIADAEALSLDDEEARLKDEIGRAARLLEQQSTLSRLLAAAQAHL